MSRPFALTILVVLITAAGGCATVVAPPPVKDSVALYLTNYGRHSSVLLRDAQGQLLEYAYGDWDWFAEARISRLGAVRAMLFSGGAALGRRQLDVEDTIDAVASATGAEHVARILVPRHKADRLLHRLDDAYDRQLDTMTYNPVMWLWFVRSRDHYSAFHNCNHATADWLKSLGCRIRGPVMFSAFKVRAPGPEKMR